MCTSYAPCFPAFTCPVQFGSVQGLSLPIAHFRITAVIFCSQCELICPVGSTACHPFKYFPPLEMVVDEGPFFGMVFVQDLQSHPGSCNSLCALGSLTYDLKKLEQKGKFQASHILFMSNEFRIQISGSIQST